MASALLIRTLVGLRSVRSLNSYATHNPKNLTSLFNQTKAFQRRVVRASFVYATPRLVSCAMYSSTTGAMATFATQSVSTNEPVVSVDWLHANLREPDVKKNWNLFSVNVAVAGTGLYQLSRKIRFLFMASVNSAVWTSVDTAVVTIWVFIAEAVFDIVSVNQ